MRIPIWRLLFYESEQLLLLASGQHHGRQQDYQRRAHHAEQFSPASRCQLPVIRKPVHPNRPNAFMRRKTIATNDIYMLLMRAAMGEKLDQQESAMLKDFLNSTRKN